MPVLRLGIVLFSAVLAACAGRQRLAPISACSPADSSGSDVIRVITSVVADPQVASRLQLSAGGSGDVQLVLDPQVCGAAVDAYRSRCGVTFEGPERVQVARLADLYVVVAPTILSVYPRGLVYQVFDAQWKFRSCFSPTNLRGS